MWTHDSHITVGPLVRSPLVTIPNYQLMQCYYYTLHSQFAIFLISPHYILNLLYLLLLHNAFSICYICYISYICYICYYSALHSQFAVHQKYFSSTNIAFLQIGTNSMRNSLSTIPLFRPFMFPIEPLAVLQRTVLCLSHIWKYILCACLAWTNFKLSLAQG